MNRSTFMLISFFLVTFTAVLSASGQEAELRLSDKKQLFVFPVQYDTDTRNMTSANRAFFESHLMRELVYDFPRFAFYEMPADAKVDSFLANANEYLLEHAQEIKQKRVETGGRYGEAPITLDDLKAIVENGYAFVPHMSKATFKDKSWDLEARLDIYRTSTQEKVGAVRGSSSSLTAIVHSLSDPFELVDGSDDKKKLTEKEIREQFENKARGVVQELRTELRKMDEFSIRAIVTTPGINQFTFNRGKDLGVEQDARYKIWSTSDPTAEGRVLLAYGKVREIRDHEADVQVLIGGWDVTYADQVVEDARIGINLMPVLGVLPIETSGFDQFKDGTADIPGDNDSEVDFPEDASAPRMYFGGALEYNTAPFIGISEFYVTAEAGFIGLQNTLSYHVSAGITKKLWFRRAALLLSGRYGIIGINFPDLNDAGDNEDDSRRIANDMIHGFVLTTGIEVLITPDIALQGQAGYAFFPEQDVLSEKEEEIGFGDQGHSATMSAVGIFVRAGILFSL